MDPWDGLLRGRVCHFLAMAMIQWDVQEMGAQNLDGSLSLSLCPWDSWLSSGGCFWCCWWRGGSSEPPPTSIQLSLGTSRHIPCKSCVYLQVLPLRHGGKIETLLILGSSLLETLKKCYNLISFLAALGLLCGMRALFPVHGFS